MCGNDATRRVRRFLPAIACAVLSCGTSPAGGQGPVLETEIPRITRITPEGKHVVVEDDQIGEFEIRLFQRFQKADPPDELFAFRKDGLYFGTPWSFTEIIIRGNRAELRHTTDDSQDRYFHRMLSDEELGELRRFIKKHRLDTLRSFRSGLADGVEYQHYHFTKEGGRWLRINNPPRRDDDLWMIDRWKPDDPRWVYPDLIELWERLADPAKLQIRYLLSRRLPQLEVLFAHPNRRVYDVWARGDDIRLLVDRQGFGHWEWRALVDGRPGDVVETPEGHPPSRPLPGAVDMTRDAGQDLAPYSSSLVLQPGFWRDDDSKAKDRAKTPEDALKAELTTFVETPDGRWLVGIHYLGGVVCFDRKRQKERRPPEPMPGRRYTAIEYIPAHGKVLLGHEPEKAANGAFTGWVGFGAWGGAGGADWKGMGYELLDPQTRETTPVEMYHCPWFERRERPLHTWPELRKPFLQPTARPHLVWVLYWNLSVGRYDTKEFKFLDGFEVPNLVFSGGRQIHSLRVDSGDMWVDETTRRVYFVDRGHLLCLPMPESAFPDLAGKSR